MSVRSRWRRLRHDLRAAGLMGRAYRLRDRGELEEALAVCNEAITLAGPTEPDDPGPNSLSTIVMGARTIDEIASRLGRPEIAREPLANALLFLQRFNRQHAGRVNDLLRRYEQQIRARLEELR